MRKPTTNHTPWVLSALLAVLVLGGIGGIGLLYVRPYVIARYQGQGAQLRGVMLLGARLHGANLYVADLQGANLRGADLSGAELAGANLTGASLQGACLDNADLRSTVLDDADLSRAHLANANLTKASLGHTDLQGADLSWANLNTNLASTYIDSTTQLDARWRLLRDLQTGAGAGRDLRNADLQEAFLRRARLKGANLEGANLRQAILAGADLRGANLVGANLAGALLDTAIIDHATRLDPEWRLVVELLARDGKGRDLHSTDLAGAALASVNLGSANLRGADLQRTDLGNTVLRGADLRGADLRGAEIYRFTTEADRFPGGPYIPSDPASRQRSYADLGGARYDVLTRWPAGFDPRKYGAVLTGGSPSEPAGELDPHDELGYIRRLKRSSEPEARAIVRQIENGPRDLARQRAAARREGIPLTPRDLRVPAPPPALDAAPLYTRLIRILREKPLDQKADEISGRLGTRMASTPEDRATVRKMLAGRRDVMALIHQAADRPRCAFHRNYAGGLKTFTVFAPEGTTLRHAVRLLRAESYLLAEAGRYQEAIANQARGFRIAEHAAVDPNVVSFGVAGACQAITLAGMQDILYVAGPNARVAEQVRAAILARRSGLSLSRVLSGEAVIQALTLAELRQGGPAEVADVRPWWRWDEPESGERSGASSPRPKALLPADQPLWNELMDAAEADSLRRMRRLVPGAEKPYLARKALFEQVRSLSPASSINPVYFLHDLFSSMVETYAIAARHEASGRAQQESVLAGAALLAYRARHSAFPDRLEQAVPALPLDPFSGQPLKYRREGSGLVVYSVGENGHYDGGKPGLWPDGRQSAFRYPPPPPRLPPPPLTTPSLPPTRH